MTDFIKILKEKAEEIPEYISVSEIPDEVIAAIEKYQFKADKNGVESLFLTLRTKDNKRIVQKYPPSTWRELEKAFEKLGGTENLTNKYIKWEKGLIGRIQKPRLIPKAVTEK